MAVVVDCVQPLVPSRLFISNAGGTAGDGQGGGSVLETLLNLILSEKAGINPPGKYLQLEAKRRRGPVPLDCPTTQEARRIHSEMSRQLVHIPVSPDKFHLAH